MKVILPFFFAFILKIQFATAARLVRDVAADNTADDPSKSFEKAFDSLKKGIEETFTKDNVNVSERLNQLNLGSILINFVFLNLQKIIDNLGDMGTKLKELGQNLATKVQEKANDLNKKSD